MYQKKFFCFLPFILAYFFFPLLSQAQDFPELNPPEKSDYGAIGGVVKPVRRAILSFAHAGTLIKVPEEGQMLKRGNIIAKLDDTRSKIQIAEAEAALEAAKLTLESDRHNLLKTERLFQEKILAPIALTEAEFSLKKSQAQVRIAEAKLKSALLQLKECNLKAPFDGVVVQALAAIGEQADSGKQIAELVDLSSLELSVNIPFELTEKLNPGFVTDIMTGTKIVGKAKVKTILPLLDAASGLRRVIWQIIPENNNMLTGSYVRLKYWD